MGYKWQKKNILNIVEKLQDDKYINDEVAIIDIKQMVSLIDNYRSYFANEEKDLALQVQNKITAGKKNRKSDSKKENLQIYGPDQAVIYNIKNNFRQLDIDEQLLNVEMSTDKKIAIINDFLENINPRLKEIFRKRLENGYIMFDADEEYTKDSDGSYYLSYLFKESFVTYNSSNNNIKYFATFVHELGHMFDYELANFSWQSNSMYFSREILPNVFMLLFFDYLYNSTSLNQDQYQELKKEYYRNFHAQAYLLNEIIAARLYYKNNEQLNSLDDIKLETEIEGVNYSPERLKELILFSACSRLIHAYRSDLLAHDLYVQINEGKFTATEVINHLAQERTKDFDEVFQKFGYEPLTYDILEEKVMIMYEKVKAISDENWPEYQDFAERDFITKKKN